MTYYCTIILLIRVYVQRIRYNNIIHVWHFVLLVGAFSVGLKLPYDATISTQSFNCGVICGKGSVYGRGHGPLHGTPAPELDGISSLVHCIPSFITLHTCARGNVIGRIVVVIVIHKINIARS